MLNYFVVHSRGGVCKGRLFQDRLSPVGQYCHRTSICDLHTAPEGGDCSGACWRGKGVGGGMFGVERDEDLSWSWLER